MLRRHRMPLVMVVVFVCAFVVAAASVQAAGESGKVVLTRSAKSTSRLPVSHSFTRPATTASSSCYGACDCNVCVCYGGLGCCLLGCDACWEVLDEGGGCGAI